tara:strand:+ start:318 stop:581 length:264 start_codon:yes stop_codon:yes gene_type:complete
LSELKNGSDAAFFFIQFKPFSFLSLSLFLSLFLSETQREENDGVGTVEKRHLETLSQHHQKKRERGEGRRKNNDVLSSSSERRFRRA